MKKVIILLIFLFVGKSITGYCQQVIYSEINNGWYISYSGEMRYVSGKGQVKDLFNIIGTKKIIDSLSIYSYGGDAGPLYQKIEVLNDYPSDTFAVDNLVPVYDTIADAKEIKILTLQNGKPAYAIVENYGKNYLMKYANGRFQLHPLLNKVALKGTVLMQLMNCVVLTMMISVLVYVFYRTANDKKKILELVDSSREENALQTKSEKPVGTEDEDLLGFHSLEECIVRVMRNTELELPLTMVISGTWGSGKSSMMNRIKEKLEGDKKMRRRFLTTWFNAWHVQGETNLLSSFLLNIVGCYEQRYDYGFFSFFRMKLAYIRFLQLSVLKKFIFGFSIAIVVPFVLLLIVKSLGISEERSSVIYEYCTSLKHIFSFDSKGGFGFHTLTPIGAGVLIIFSIFFLNKQFMPAGLSAFFELLPRNNFVLEAEKMEPGSRSKFKKEFWEIMEAGEKGTRLVVFVDDLDRISGDKILELIEAINFISDVASKPPGSKLKSPNIIFVLGMYTAEVTRNVGVQLKKVNDANMPAETLGALYVEKMVQLIVPVPFDSSNKEKLRKLYEN
ncbi:P-loop NTPase fold protein [Chitinophaga sp. S165]|uniref:P-loop NTPase fold protein n=1 Tax=Chitinophaga sp. S165 TaxID=2135462 RepID=UPI000D70E69D|nr:P-loop NTPase fold protein [Chitinophaga sp. S165]PWV56132.1 KAP-like P-loop domain-containing protein [Chitinophaga sp. S165]